MPFPSLCCNRVLTILSISSLLTTFTVGPTAGLTATPTSFASMAAFIFCSAYSGHATIGTLFVRLSKLEFHPQWDRNPPTDGWVNISIWFAHIWTTNPTSRGGRTTQMNLCWLFSNPQANSAVCSAVKNPPLPNDTYKTDSTGCLSNHFKISLLPSPSFFPSAFLFNGPIGYIGTFTIPRNSSFSLRALTVLGSSSSQVLINSPSNRVYSIPRLTYSRQSSSPSRGRMISVPRNPQFLGNGQGLGTKYVDNQGVGAAVHGGDAGPDARKCLPDRYP
nr:Os06g0343500 protein [Ipomoea batatas]